jgi:hypothetical protein
MMGAIAFQKDLGAVHSCAAHALGAVCDLHHGLTNALMIDTVMAWNYEAVPAKFDELAHVCKVSGGGGAAFVPWLRDAQAASVGITGTLTTHGVTAAHLSAPGGDCAVNDICHQTNPRPVYGGGFRATLPGGAVIGDLLLRPGPSMSGRLKIGISACFLHPDPAAQRCSRSRPSNTSNSPWRTGSWPPARCRS